MVEIFIIVVSLLISVYPLYVMRLGLDSVKWANTSGILKELEIKTRIFQPKFPSLQEPVDAGLVKVKYEYYVNGKRYTGKRISYSTEYYRPMVEIEADIIIHSLKNNEFFVYYNVDLPNQSVLKPGFEDVPSTVWFVIFMLCGGALLAFLYHLASPYFII